MENQEVIQALEQKNNPRADRRAEGTPLDPSFWWRMVHLDPVLLRGGIVAIVGLLTAFGMVVSDQRLVAILTAVAAVVAVIQAVWTRGSVTPNAKVVVYKPDPVGSPEQLKSGAAVSTDIVELANAAADTSDGDRPANQLPFPERVPL